MPSKNRYLLYIWTGLSLCSPTLPFPRPHSIGNPLIPFVLWVHHSCYVLRGRGLKWSQTDFIFWPLSLSSPVKAPLLFWKSYLLWTSEHGLSQLTWKSYLLWTHKHGSVSADRGLRTHIQARFGWWPREIPPFSKAGSSTKRERVENTPLEFIHIWLRVSQPCLPSTRSLESSDNVRSLWSK